MLSNLIKSRLRHVSCTSGLHRHHHRLKARPLIAASYYVELTNRRHFTQHRPHPQQSITLSNNDHEPKKNELLVRLKRDEETRKSPQAWNEAFRSLKSSEGSNGVDIVFEALQAYPLNEVPLLYDLELWQHLYGKKLISYVHQLHKAGVQPPNGTLKKIGYEYHNLDWLRPNDDELVQAAVQSIDVELPKGKYNALMTQLCAKKDYRKALAWHQKLVARGEPPRLPTDVEPLRQLLLERKKWASALEVKRDVRLHEPSISNQDRPNDDSSYLSIEEQRQALQTFVSKLDERVGVSQFSPSMEDHTCARFFATRFFSVPFIMEGLSLFGITQLGPLATRELVKRSIRGQHCDASVVQQYFAKMNSLGITSESRYGRMLKYFAELNKDVLIHSIVTSDFHPDLYDDLEFQERQLGSSDALVIERTRQVLMFENIDHGIEVRNILLRAGREDVESMIADNIPITEASRKFMIEEVYIGRSPWISETKLRVLIRIFARLPYVTAKEWRQLIRTLLHRTQPHLREDLEALLLNVNNPKVFDSRLMSDIIRWYMRLASLEKTPRMESILGGVKVLAALRDLGLVKDIHKACEANLVSLFGETPIIEIIDRKKRIRAHELGTCEDFVVAIRQLYDSNMWPGKSPSQVKARTLAKAHKLEKDRSLRSQSSHSGLRNPGRIHYLQSQINKLKRSASAAKSLIDPKTSNW